MSRPRLYLDVDGVLNAYLASPETIHLRGMRAGVANDFLITWDPSVVRALLDLPVDIIWATTWMHQANSHISPLLDLGTYPVCGPLNTERRDTYLSCGKPVPEAVMDFDGPVIWIDDDLGSLDYEWADARDGMTLLIAPYGTHGLTHAHLDLIKAFLVEQSQAA